MKTYDIINAGPRNRFMANGRIVSNSGRGVQMQNLTKSDLSLQDLTLARELLKARRPEISELLFGPLQPHLSELIRTAFIAPPGKSFVVVDFSAIEARVVAWLAGCEWRLEVFKTHGKIYEASAEQMFKLPPGSVDKKSPYRQKGKVAELACFGPDTLVLTDAGYVQITDITERHKLWDGISWVRHQGVVFRGWKETMELCQVAVTPDHLIRTNKTWLPAKQLGSSEQDLFQALETGSENLPSSERLARSAVFASPIWSLSSVHVGALRTLCMRAISTVARALDAIPAQKRKLGSGGKATTTTRTSARTTRPGAAYLIGYPLALFGATHRTQGNTEITGDEESTYGGLGVAASATSLPIWSRFRAGITQHLSSIVSTSIRGISRAIFGLLRSQKTPRTREASGTCRKKSPVFDLLLAGPRNRFTILSSKGPLIVHNCGYMGGPGALIAMGALKMGLKEEELQPIITAWRKANPEIVDFAHGMERNAKTTIRQKVTTGVPGKYQFRYESGMLFMDLPSGRSLCYVKPRIEEEGGFKNITYDGMDQDTKRWGRTKTYAGKLLENVTQAIARDCLAAVLPKFEAAEMAIVGHVHDEAILEVDDRLAQAKLTEAEAIMGQPLHWAPGLPLSGEGFVSKFYRKE